MEKPTIYVVELQRARGEWIVFIKVVLGSKIVTCVYLLVTFLCLILTIFYYL